MPFTSSECIIAEMVALVAVDAAFASFARVRSRSLPLPSHASAYVWRAAGQEMVCRICVIMFRSVASTSSCATMYRLASAAVKGGRPAAAETGAAAVELAVVVADCDCERVCRVVACRVGGATDPWLAKIGLRGEGESNV
eukprot:3357416-Pleurochrysis_carterae.AAC.2